MTYSALYLRLPNGAQIPISCTLIDDGILIQGLDQIDICFEITGLNALQSILSPTSRQQHVIDPRSLTPVDVVAYFERSPILSIYVDDVKSELLGHSKPLQADYQLKSDLEAVAGLVDPSQADIAERLFGDRQKTGGAYRRRILAVQGATTTPRPATLGSRKQEKAA